MAPTDATNKVRVPFVVVPEPSPRAWTVTHAPSCRLAFLGEYTELVGVLQPEALVNFVNFIIFVFLS